MTITIHDVLQAKLDKARPLLWIGDVPTLDDLGAPILNEFIDGKTVFGPWAMMTPESFRTAGIRLGPGWGQRYVKRDDRWFKVEG